MMQVLRFSDLPPKDKRAIYKEALRQARINLLNAQMIVGPLVETYKDLDELIGTLEDMITKKETPGD